MALASSEHVWAESSQRPSLAALPPTLKGILDEVGATLEEVCFVGDDVNDLLVLRSVGLPVTVADAELELFSNVAMITHRRGGQGVLRELAEVLLRSQGRWTA